MAIPLHANQMEQERKAFAPYNFVPLPNTIRFVENPPSQGYYDEKLLSGKVSCVLTNSTPIYVRAAQTLEEYKEEKVSSEPFYYGVSDNQEDKLLIPGSSIRGMLRTLVEVVSYSRITPISDKQLFYRSVENTSMGEVYRDRMKDKVRAGFFHRDQSEAWIIPTIAARVERKDIRKEFGVIDIYEEFDETHTPIKASSTKRIPKKILQHQVVYIQIDENAYNEPERFYTVLEFSRKQAEGLEKAVLVITGDMKVRPAKDGTKKEKKEFVFLEQIRMLTCYPG